MTNGNPVEWGKIVKDIGFPAFVALMLLAALFGWIPTPMLTEHRTLVKQLGRHMEDDHTKTYLLRQICQNLAVNKEEARKCLRDALD